MQIAERTVVSFHYTLTNDAGDVLDSSDGREPLAYLHGAGNIVPGLEREMSGHVAGDKFMVDVAAADGYGDYIEELVQTVPRESFQGVDDLAVGIERQGPTGRNGLIGEPWEELTSVGAIEREIRDLVDGEDREGLVCPRVQGVEPEVRVPSSRKQPRQLRPLMIEERVIVQVAPRERPI